MAERDKWKQKAKDLAVTANGRGSEEEKQAWDNFKKYRNKVNNKKRYDEIEFKRKKLEENIDHPNKTWGTAKKFMNWKGKSTPSQLEAGGVLLTKAKQIASSSTR